MAQTNSTAKAASVGSTVDSIADLLTNDDAAVDDVVKDVKEDEDLVEDSEDVSDESEESTDEEESESDDDDESEESEESDEEGDDTWSSVLGVSEEKLSFDEDGNLTGIKIKVDGKESTMKLDEVIAGFQTNRHNTQKSQALAEDRKAFDEERTTSKQEYTSKLEQAEQLNSILERKLLSDYEGVDWNNLRASNPAEYAALRQDYASKAQEIQHAKSVIDQEKQIEHQELLVENQGRQIEYLKQQHGKMIENNPTWADESTRKKDMGALASFLEESYGFSDNDLKYVQDARLIELIKDARKFRVGSKVAEKKIKKPVPKFQKTNAKATKKVSKLAKLTKQANAATGANRRVAQRDAVAELLMGGNR